MPEMDIFQSLNTLTFKELSSVHKRLGGGFDFFRGPKGHAGWGKDAAIEWLVAGYTESDLMIAIQSVVGDAKNAKAVEKAVPVNNQPEVAVVNDKAEAVKQLLDVLGVGGADESKIRDIVREELGQVRPKVIQLNDNVVGRMDEHTHPLFEKVVRLCQAGLNVMLVGPAGCGKTHLAGQVAKALGRPFGSISGSAGVSEAQLTGRLLPTGGGGKFEYHESPFVKQYANGGLFLFDELDAFDANCLLTVNQATANGGFEIEARAASGLDTFVKRHNQTILIGSANTYGSGASAMYVGRAGLDASSVDRWYMVQMDYDPAFEASLAGMAHTPAKAWKAAAAPTPSEIEDIGRWVLELRSKVNNSRLRRIVSTRTMQKAIAARQAGIPTNEVKSDVLCGWSEDERSKVGV